MIGFPIPKNMPNTSAAPILIGWNAGGGVVDDATEPNPATVGDYNFPGCTNGTNTFTGTDLLYAAAKGCNFLCFPFSWQQVQPVITSAISTSTAYFTALQTCVSYALSLGMWVSIRPSPYWSSSGGVYLGYGGKYIGQSGGGPSSAQYANFWSEMATFFNNPSNLAYKCNTNRLIFDLGNEPNTNTTPGQTNALLQTAYQAAITAIRATGAANMIFVEGNGYTACSNWNSTSVYGSTANCTTFLALTDPINNLVACVHSYFDGSTSYSGTGADISLAASPTVADNTIGTTHLTLINDQTSTTGILPHSQANGNYRIFIGEMGVSHAPSVGNATTCMNNLVATMGANTRNILGAAWWVFGAQFQGDESGNPYEVYPDSGSYPTWTDNANIAPWQIMLPLKAQ
jgi:hypothetical protein